MRFVAHRQQKNVGRDSIPPIFWTAGRYRSLRVGNKLPTLRRLVFASPFALTALNNARNNSLSRPQESFVHVDNAINHPTRLA
jgi:hypothetical protein